MVVNTVNLSAQPLGNLGHYLTLKKKKKGLQIKDKKNLKNKKKGSK